MKRIAFTFFIALTASGQAPHVLDVDIANTTAYVYDSADYQKFATDPNLLPVGQVRTFGVFMNFGDVVAVNGDAVKGTWILRHQVFRMTTTPTPGSSIGDINRFGIVEHQLEILSPDGAPIGAIFMQGQSFGSAAAGAPPASNGASMAVVGGTGAFLGARGQATTAPARITGTARNASVLEDPSLRLLRGGGGQRVIIQLIPNSIPEVAAAVGALQVFHTDFSPVNAASPARAGETLIAYAKGLGATSPALDPNGVFPSEALATVIAPVQVLVNGTATIATTRVGIPGTTDMYRLDFQLPDSIATSTATIRLRAAWIPGPEVRIPVR